MSVSRTLAIAVFVVIAAASGWFARGLFSSATTSGTAVEAESRAGDPGAEERCPDGSAPRLWRAPMDPGYVRDRPGKSPMGMDLVPVCESGDGLGAGGVRIDPTVVQNIGVRTAPVTRRDLSRTIRAAGRVAWDERRVAHVHTKVQGWVETLHVDFLGERVERGEPLLELYSPELVSTQEELLVAARYRTRTAGSEFDDVSQSGRSLYDATLRRLELWDVDGRDVDRLLETGEVQRTLTLRAPTSGVVTSLEVRSGMEVAPNANLYTIADPSHVWVTADVYEYELPWVELGQAARVELPYLRDADLSGPITYVSPFLDPATRTAEIRVELANPDGQLRPGMFGNVFIEGTPHRDAVAIPSEAVIRSGRRSIAIVALGEGRFEPRPIVTGLSTGDGTTEIVAGLEPGEVVVVSSQFLIDSESQLQEAIDKLLGEDRPSRAEPRDPPPGSPDPSTHTDPGDGVDHSAMGH